MSSEKNSHYDIKYMNWELDNKYLKKSISDDTLVLKELMKYCWTGTHQSILELGCGIGYKSRILYELGFDVMGVDFSEIAIQKAKKWWGRNILFTCMDFNSSILKTKYDIVYSSSFSPLKHEFKKDDSDVLKRMFSYLKPMGFFVFEWGRNSKHEEICNDWGYITIEQIKKRLSKYGEIVLIRANHRQLARFLNGFYFSKYLTRIVMFLSKFHNRGYRLYVVVRKNNA